MAGGFPPRHLAPVDPGLCPGWGAEMNGEAHERTALLLISSPRKPTGREADRPPRSARTTTHRKVTKAVRIGAHMREEDAKTAVRAMRR